MKYLPSYARILSFVADCFYYLFMIVKIITVGLVILLASYLPDLAKAFPHKTDYAVWPGHGMPKEQRSWEYSPWLLKLDLTFEELKALDSVYKAHPDMFDSIRTNGEFEKLMKSLKK